MKAAVYTETGAATEVLEIRDEIKPTPEKDEVLVALRASGTTSRRKATRWLA